MHIGEPVFYERVYKEAAEHDLVLLEGVQSKVVRNLTRSYRWVPLKRMGLILQPKFDNCTRKRRVWAWLMPAIVRFLRALGDDRPEKSEWKTVFDL